jgi:hypothetical protein
MRLRRQVIQLSVMGDAAEQKRIASCQHRWERVHAVAWGYLKLDDRCSVCGTYRRRPTLIGRIRALLSL